MGQKPSTSIASAPPASRFELDQFADETYEKTLADIDGISSFNFGLDDIFCYQHYKIPDLGGRQVWSFKATIRAPGATFIELRKTSDLTDITALSYAWGETLRITPVCIGVYEDGSRCEARLGYEWSVQSFVSILVELSTKSWLWMDQIAKQPETTTADVISTFPAVYSRCSVVVLLPGTDCQFLRGLKDRVLSSSSLSYEGAKAYLELMVEHFSRCKSYRLKRRWFERVWTRQEALYARRIRIVHVSDRSDSCVWNNDTQESRLEDLLGFRSAMVNIAEVLGTKMNSPDVLTESSGVQIAQGIIAQTGFILGIQLVCVNNSPSLARSLSRLAETNRRTTDSKDLILSVWPGINLSNLFAEPANEWAAAYENMAKYYESEFGAVIPCGLAAGATQQDPFHSVERSSLGRVPAAVPSVRSLYSPFQYLQVGALRDGGRTYLQVAYERITVRNFPSLNCASDAVDAIARYIDGLPVWMLRTWWKCILNAIADEDSECLVDSVEASIFSSVLTARLSAIDTSDIKGQFSNTPISPSRIAGLLVMCATGTWGRDPEVLSNCAAIVCIDGRDRICAGWPGTYRLAFGKGNGDVYGVSVSQSGDVYVRAVIPLPLHASQHGSLWRNSPKYYSVL